MERRERSHLNGSATSASETLSTHTSRAPSDSPPTVLIVDGDVATRQTIERGLRSQRFSVVSACSGAEAIAVATARPVDCAVVEHHLPDMTGTDLVGTLRGRSMQLPFVLISDFLSVSVVVEAMKLGADDVVEKPFDVDGIVATVSSVARRQRARPNGHAPGVAPRDGASVGSVAERWAQHVLIACEAENDPKTLAEWARVLGVSYTSLCERCRILGIRPYDARDFARVLRALIQGTRHNCVPEAFLDVSDRRTLATMLKRAGVKNLAEFHDYPVATFVRRQSFVASDNEGVKRVTAMITRS